MTISRRAVFAGAAVSALAASAARAQAGAAPSASPPPSIEERLARRAAENRYPLHFDGERFSGPGWDLLLAEGRRSKFFMLGEEHGLAENAKLAAGLVEALAPAGYDRVAVEVSPPMAAEMGQALDRGGLDGLKRLFAQPGATPAFFGMREEAEWLARARRVLPRGRDVLWGLDYEVGADRRLIARLKTRPKPAAARSPMTALATASTAAWADYEKTRNPGLIFSFSGDPQLVRALRSAWPRPDPESAWILDTLEETLEINRLWGQQKGWESNQRRAAFMRANFARYWAAEGRDAARTRVFFKFGASHLVRGRNMSEVMDVGSLIHETAALSGERSFNALVVGGAGARTARFNPVAWRYEEGPASDAEDEAIGFLAALALEGGFTVIDLRPLRPLLDAARARKADPRLVRVVHGFDVLVSMPGAHASANL